MVCHRSSPAPSSCISEVCHRSSPLLPPTFLTSTKRKWKFWWICLPLSLSLSLSLSHKHNNHIFRIYIFTNRFFFLQLNLPLLLLSSCTRMDRRLIVAAQMGDVDLLLNLIQYNPLILHSVSLTEEETPLYIASMAGHLNFVRKILELMPKFAEVLNQDGFSPLHIASVNGYLEIVKELLSLNVNRDLCTLMGRDKRIPLHYAAINGRIHVMEKLLAASLDSVEHVTVRGETALHLAVKKNRIEALRVLVEHLKNIKKEGVLNMEDEHGNTILHLAISGRRYEAGCRLIAW
ncbi:hypothetical protein ACSBR1_041995 [Camellia fascicularis]